MKMNDDDKILDAGFAQMRAQDVVPSEGLLDRIMMDADSVLAANIAPPVRTKQGLGAMVLDVIGGWPSFGGLAAATVAGLWIGVAPPAALADISAGYLGSTVEVPLFDTEILLGLDG
ncbi:hypothetical protein L0664_02695 [Octadecabacter sp. G9-8]|uniref:Dihydroorotate dehydrogenase n=1 Tax=Octadecabacter dasysiphoniae TaxID=2909341 RepID=A0ABS9CRV3_9RHOB|nr:hypothetical protein [Octadecabacter dasysiphoniae]MCF2869965.1 hypothetical protein [Octadecabacter dasysiphoniae]